MGQTVKVRCSCGGTDRGLRRDGGCHLCYGSGFVRHSYLCAITYGEECDCDPSIQDTNDVELERLRAWKAEALIVLAEWEKVWEAAGRPGRLGESKATSVLRLLEDAYFTVDDDVWCERCGEEAGDCTCGRRKVLVIQ